jgi:hypothetical protein
MLKLREKAHASLQAFRDGRSSPLIRSATLCDSDMSGEEDELTLLGGKTRLVGKGSAPTCPPSPHIIQESPSSHHPVVPFPLRAIDEHMHPTVLDYLRSFGPSRTPQPQQLPQPQLVVSTSASANSMLFTPPAPPLPDPGAIFDITTSYPSPAVSVPSAPQTPLKHGLTENALDVSLSFPSYFPVFDYGGPTGAGILCSPIHLDPQIPEEQSVRNSTPEGTMQSSWQDLIAQFDFGLY